MSELVPSLIGLDKGLNLQTAKLVAPAGSVLDTLNYEQVDFQGQKRIDGFTRYDGSLLATLDEYYKITVDGDAPGVAGDLIKTNGELLGVVVGTHETGYYVAVIDANQIPVVDDEVTILQNGVATDASVVTECVTGTASADDADEHYNNLLAFSEVLRNLVEELPGSIIGLHWFRDRLYAVADVTTVSLEGTTPTIYPNDLLVLDSTGEEVKVLDALTRGNTRLLFINSMTPSDWQVEGVDVTREAISVGVIANGYETVTSEEEIASFFESRSEAQVLEEDGPSGPYDFGWRFVDLGWSVLFNNGVSLYGSLPSLNQNITGLGTQGPTSVAGNNGRPLIVLQNVNINGDEESQVNGWKSSQTPNSYALESDNLIDQDGDTIYADAYISWNGDTTEVVGFTEELTEYPATNTVEIEL